MQFPPLGFLDKNLAKILVKNFKVFLMVQDNSRSNQGFQEVTGICGKIQDLGKSFTGKIFYTGKRLVIMKKTAIIKYKMLTYSMNAISRILIHKLDPVEFNRIQSEIPRIYCLTFWINTQVEMNMTVMAFQGKCDMPFISY